MSKQQEATLRYFPPKDVIKKGISCTKLSHTSYYKAIKMSSVSWFQMQVSYYKSDVCEGADMQLFGPAKTNMVWEAVYHSYLECSC